MGFVIVQISLPSDCPNEDSWFCSPSRSFLGLPIESAVPDPDLLAPHPPVWRRRAKHRCGGVQLRGREGEGEGRWWARALPRLGGQVIASYTPSYTRKWNLSMTGPQPARTGGLPENRIFMNFGKRKLRSASYR